MTRSLVELRTTGVRYLGTYRQAMSKCEFWPHSGQIQDRPLLPQIPSPSLFFLPFSPISSRSLNTILSIISNSMPTDSAPELHHYFETVN